jgi:hypothetical protein
MKRLTTLALFIGILGVGSALAQSDFVSATVPFAFTIGNKLLPPGTYTISRERGDLIAIQNWNRDVMILNTMFPDNDESAHHAQLIFDKIGNQYFLRKVLGGPSAVNVFFPESKSEGRALTRETMASNPSQVSIPLSEGN